VRVARRRQMETGEWQSRTSVAGLRDAATPSGR
jgi:hypothetical protein